MDKRVLWILGGLLVFIISVNFMTRQYTAEFKAMQLPVTGELKDVPRAKQNVITPIMATENKVREGIVVVNRFNKPQTQVEWDRFMKDLVSTTGMMETDEGREAMKKKAINPLQYDDTMRRLEEESQKVQAAYANAPNDPLLQRRMQDLRKMKALMKVLVEKGVVASDAPELPGMNAVQDAQVLGR